MATPNPPSPLDNSFPMSNLSPDSLTLPADSEIWASLKQAIAASSGFQRWHVEHCDPATDIQAELDTLVRRYLRETLETLAY